MKLTIQLQSSIDSDELQRLVNHLSKLQGFEFIIDPSYDCKINVKSTRKKSKEHTGTLVIKNNGSN